MNLSEYHQNIEQVWLKIEECLEQQDCDVDCDIHGSVFTITFADCSQVVVNKQEPLLELWLASKAGGFHFSFKEDNWITTDGKLFWQCLEQACHTHGEKVSFS